LVYQDLGKEVQNAILFDVGEYSLAREFVFKNQLIINQLFLTHGHYDHIYGIEDLLNDFPNCEVNGHPFALQCLQNEKLNLSHYYDFVICCKGFQGSELTDTTEVKIFDNYVLKVYHTPGHNPGSVTYKLSDSLFTGDSYIPFIPVVTKLKGGNRIESRLSLNLIANLIDSETEIYPGHGEKFIGSELILKDLMLYH
jgi:glyoxylase-like metal-dependent hydrolase (beta-lactamase superfamily II)